MAQIYASYIRTDDKIRRHLLCLTDDTANEHQTMLISFYHLHFLISATKTQNHLMSSLNDSFFNELSLFKDKLLFVFQYNTSDLVPMYIVYKCHSNKVSIATKKKIMKMFSEVGLNVKIKPEPKGSGSNFTKFSFDY
jgi:hypothetical protein